MVYARIPVVCADLEHVFAPKFYEHTLRHPLTYPGHGPVLDLLKQRSPGIWLAGSAKTWARTRLPDLNLFRGPLQGSQCNESMTTNCALISF